MDFQTISSVIKMNKIFYLITVVIYIYNLPKNCLSQSLAVDNHLKIISPKILISIINQENLDNQQELNLISIAQGKLLSTKGAFDFILDSEWKSYSNEKDYSELDTNLTYPTPILGIDLWAGHRKTSGDLPSYWEEGATANKGEISIGTKIPLLQGLILDKRRANFWQSEFKLSAQKKQYDQKYIEIVKEALNLYFDWALLEKKQLIASNLLFMSQQRASWLDLKVKAGSIALFEKEDNDRTIFQRKSALLDIQNKYQQSWMSLLLFINGYSSLDQSPKFYTASNLGTIMDIEILNVEDWKSKALGQRNDFLSLNDLIEAQKISINLAEQEYLPQLNIKSEMVKNQGGTQINEKDDYRISINFEMPLQLREARGKYLSAKAEHDNLQLKKKFFQQKIENSIMASYLDFENIKSRLLIMQEEVALALKLEKGEQRRFNLGDSNMVILNLREQATAEAQMKYQEMLVALWKTKIDLYSLAGELPDF